MPEENLLHLKELIALHERWKLTLWSAVFNRTPLTEEQVSQIVHPHLCPIGRWLASPRSEGLRDTPEYQAVEHHHTEFHGEMMQVASRLAAKDYRGGARAIANDSTFMQTSRELAQALSALNRVARMEVPA